MLTDNLLMLRHSFILLSSLSMTSATDLSDSSDSIDCRLVDRVVSFAYIMKLTNFTC